MRALRKEEWRLSYIGNEQAKEEHEDFEVKREEG